MKALRVPVKAVRVLMKAVRVLVKGIRVPVKAVRVLVKAVSSDQCCGSGSGRSRNFLKDPDPE